MYVCAVMVSAVESRKKSNQQRRIREEQQRKFISFFKTPPHSRSLNVGNTLLILLSLYYIVCSSQPHTIPGASAFAEQPANAIYNPRAKSTIKSGDKASTRALEMSSTTNDKESDQRNQPKQQEIKVLGVCGGIGSGKSSACKLLVSELGCLEHLGKQNLAGHLECVDVGW